MYLGTHRESGIWWSPLSRWRLICRHHDALFVAAGRLRIRIMKRRWRP
jgi:hypothetical protein